MKRHKLICLCLTNDLHDEAVKQKARGETVQHYLRRLIRQDKPQKENA